MEFAAGKIFRQVYFSLWRKRETERLTRKNEPGMLANEKTNKQGKETTQFQVPRPVSELAVGTEFPFPAHYQETHPGVESEKHGHTQVNTQP
mmetsp:Transcript_39894/g.73603  ORF Transcript_39894/g.73603 Transcript_39894/m.73603 type:complete len:92 (+) Transcript_39894:240-515(+)